MTEQQFIRKLHHLHLLDLFELCLLAYILKCCFFENKNSIIHSPDPSCSHISTFNYDLPYDKAAMPVK
jgi:hypothetical protein